MNMNMNMNMNTSMNTNTSMSTNMRLPSSIFTTTKWRQTICSASAKVS